MMDRREFIKSTALIAAALSLNPVSLITPTFASRVKVQRLGLMTVINANEQRYQAMRYHLSIQHPVRGMLEAYCDIDAILLKCCQDIPSLVRGELRCYVHAMEQEWRRVS